MAAMWNYTSGFDFGYSGVIGVRFCIGLYILSELDDRWRSWDVMSIFRDGGNSVATLLPETEVWMTYRN